MKVFLSAYACHPNRGSEPGVGWNWLKELSKDNEVWVFIYAEQGQKKSVEEAVGLLFYQDNIHVVPITVPKIFQHRFYRIRYEIWQWKAYKIAKKTIREIKIDIIHHVTIAAWWNCGHLWKLNIPFIFGPISGAQQTPSVAYSFLRFRDRINECVRTSLFNLSWWLWQRPRRAIKKAKMVLVSNQETEKKIREIRNDNCDIVFSEAGVDFTIEKKETIIRQDRDSIKLLWSGLLIPRKNFGFLLEVLLALPANIRWFLHVAGEGKLLNYWKKKTEQYGLARHISFLGRIDYSKMIEQYQWADSFVFPSLREATGTVILEAMSCGIPVVAFDIHGASIVLDKSCGILIPIIAKNQMIKDFRNAIVKLSNNPKLRREMGEAGRRKVEENYLWEDRGKKINAIYREIIGTESSNS